MRLRFFNHNDLKQMLRVYVGTVKALKDLDIKDDYIARMTGTKLSDINWALNEKKFSIQPQDKSDIDKNTRFYRGALKSALATTN